MRTVLKDGWRKDGEGGAEEKEQNQGVKLDPGMCKERAVLDC